MKDAFELKRLGELYLEKGDYETAAMLIRRAIDVEENLTPNSIALAEDLFNYGLLCSALGKRSEAQSSLLRAWKIERSVLGSMHPETLETFRTLSETYQEEQEENRVTAEFFYSGATQKVSGQPMKH